MKDNYNKDDLEAFFRKELNQQDDSGWDIPSDNVWEGIQEGLKDESDKKRPFLFWNWWIVGIFFVVLLSVLGTYQWQQTQLNSISKQLDQNTQKLEAILDDQPVQVAKKSDDEVLNESTSMNTKEEDVSKNATYQNNIITTKRSKSATNTITTKNTTTDYEKLVIKNSNAKAPKSKKKNNRINSTSSTAADDLSLVNPNEKIKNEEVADRNITDANESNSQEPISNDQSTVAQSTEVKSENLGLQKNINADELVNKKDIKYLAPFVPIPKTYLFAIAQSLNPVVSLNTIQPIIPLKKNKLSFYGGFFTGPSNTFRTIKVTTSTNLKNNLNNQESADWGWSTSGRIGLKLGKHWSLETGLMVNEENNRLRQLLKINYRRDQEILNRSTGRLESTASLNMSSSRGDIQTDIPVSRNSASRLPTDLQIPVLLRSTRTINSIRIPLTLGYTQRINRLSFTGRIGLAYRIETSETITINEILSRQPGLDIQINDNRIRNFSNFTDDQFIELATGLDINFRFTKRLGISLSPMYFRSLKDVFDNPRVADLEVYPYQFGGQVGLTYQF